jgi:hypothetical protein
VCPHVQTVIMLPVSDCSPEALYLEAVDYSIEQESLRIQGPLSREMRRQEVLCKDLELAHETKQ